MEKTSILLVDDDHELCALVEEYLGEEGFAVRSHQDPLEGIEAACSGEFGLMILDVMLPQINGFEVLRRIRARSPIPVLMLTARGEEIDRIVGLEIGADDYLPKPFNPRELVARIRAILRRTADSEPSEGGTLPDRIEVGDVILDRPARKVTREGDAIELTTLEFELLEMLLLNAGEVLRREDLSRRVLDREFRPYDRSLDVHVSHLRGKLGPNPDGTERIKSVRGVGYQWLLMPSETESSNQNGVGS